ncbi:MAG: hypothetical protein JJ863_22940 [Deltaproteobacteria bacterium]|nr:hypothetical protein [Deltaproteobacteria bacterium]
MELLTRWSAALVVLAAGCVYDPQCVDGYVYGPDGRCMPAAGADLGMPDGSMPQDLSIPEDADPTADMPAPVCDVERFVEGRRGQCSATDHQQLSEGRPIQIARMCVMMCESDEDPDACAARCVRDMESPLSLSCAECVVASFACGQEQCTEQCSDPTNPACGQCLCDESDCPSCREVFGTCAGMPAPFCGGAIACDDDRPFPPPSAPHCMGSATRTCILGCSEPTCIDDCIADDPMPGACRDCIFRVNDACASRHPDCSTQSDAMWCCAEGSACDPFMPDCCDSEQRTLSNCLSTQLSPDCADVGSGIYDTCF